MKLRQNLMSSKERVNTLFTYGRPDRVPIGVLATAFTCRNAGHTAKVAYSDPKKSFNAGIWTAEQYDWDYELCTQFGHPVLGALDFGGEVRLPENEYEESMMTRSHPVKTEKDVENLEMPDPRTAGRIPLVMEFSKYQAANGYPVLFQPRSPFTIAAEICGLELFLKWMIRKPELCERLLSMALDHTFNVLNYWVETFGSEKLNIWMHSPSESNQLISPRHFEKFALPYHAEYHKRLKRVGLINRFSIHICGDQNLNLPYLAELSPWPHPSIISIGHEVDIEVASRYFPDDIIYGNIDPVIFQIGTPQQIYDLAKKTIEKGKSCPGGFILSAGCSMPINPPPVNIYAMTKAVHDYGWYQ